MATRIVPTTLDLVLPPGWTSAPFSGERFTVITAPELGAVTIDWRDRVFRLGVCFHGDAKIKRYAGRGWKQRLVFAAIAKLRSLA